MFGNFYVNITPNKRGVLQVGDHKIGRERIKLPVGTLLRCVEEFQGNGDIGSGGHCLQAYS